MAAINGTVMLVYDGITPLLMQKDLTIDIKVDLPDASSKDSNGWKEHIMGAKDWSAKVSGIANLLDGSNLDTILAKIIARTPITVKISTEVTGDIYFTGNASWAGVSVKASNESTIEWDGTITGNGALTVEVVPAPST